MRLKPSGVVQTLDKARLRLVKSDIDQAERQSMQRACICLHYEWILSVPDKEEAVRLRGTGIFNIMEGKVRLLFHTLLQRGIAEVAFQSSSMGL